MKKMAQIALVILLCSFSTENMSWHNAEHEPTNPENILVNINEFAEDSYNLLGVKSLFFKPYKLRSGATSLFDVQRLTFNVRCSFFKHDRIPVQHILVSRRKPQTGVA